MQVFPSNLVDWDLSTNGYIRFFNSLLIQWGHYGGGTYQPVITYPLAFTSIYGEPIGTCAGSGAIFCVTNVSTTDFQGSQFTHNGLTSTVAFTWIAIGV